MKYLHGILLLISGLAFAGKTSLVLDDFETQQPWELKEWGDSAELSLEAQQATQGRKALRLGFDKAATKLHPRGIVIRRSLLGRAADYQDFTLDIFVETRAPVKLDVAVDADQSYERPALQLQPGWNRNVQLQLLSGAFQAKTPDEKQVPLKPEDAIGTLIFSFHRTANEAGSIFIDNIRAHHRPEQSLRRSQAVKLDRHPIEIRSVTLEKSPIKVYQPVELTVDLDAKVMDPYDPEEIELKGIFTSQQGKKLEVAGFLYSGEVSDSEPVKNPVWKIRFTPVLAGEWSYIVTARNIWNSTKSGAYRLQAEAGAGDGFVRVDPKHPQYFAFDSGRFYYPIGQNVSWLPLPEYARYFSKMAKHGENWARIWMTNWSFAIEWKPMGQFQGLGTYNLDRARNLDVLLRLAAMHDLYLQLVFDFHGAYSNKVNPEWSNNPYNVVNGGFLKSPEQFFTDPRAKDLYKKRLRYIIARWGSSPNVMAWEFFNEVSFTDNFNEKAITAWHREMSSFVKTIDPYQHLTTTSYGGDAVGDVYQLPTIDFAQYHVYAQNLSKQMQRISNKLQQYQKPHFVGEFGSDSANGGDDLDKKGVFLHAGLWSQFMQPASGNAMPWWWDTHIEPNNLYYHFEALSRFAEGLDRRQYVFTPVQQKLRMKVGEQTYDFDLIGLQSPEYSMFWLSDVLGMNPGGRAQHLAYKEVKIALSDFKEDRYEVEFWDTYRGTVIKTSTLQLDAGRLALELPRFSNDIAFKIRSKKTLASQTHLER